MSVALCLVLTLLFFVNLGALTWVLGFLERRRRSAWEHARERALYLTLAKACAKLSDTSVEETLTAWNTPLNEMYFMVKHLVPADTQIPVLWKDPDTRMNVRRVIGEGQTRGYVRK